MAAQCGLSTGYISLIEKEVNPQTGKAMVPSLVVLNKLAKGMGMPLDNLLSMCDDMMVDIGAPAKTAPTAPPPARNIVRIAGRDGSYVEKNLSDEQVAALKLLIDQLPDVDDL